MASSTFQVAGVAQSIVDRRQSFCQDRLHSRQSVEFKSVTRANHASLAALGNCKRRPPTTLHLQSSHSDRLPPFLQVKKANFSPLHAVSSSISLQSLDCRGWANQRLRERTRRKPAKINASDASRDAEAADSADVAPAVASITPPDVAPSLASLVPRVEQQESWLVRVAVDGLTEVLRLLGVGGSPSSLSSEVIESSAASVASAAASTEVDILDAIRADYEDRAYFLTGEITDQIYAEDCYFGDPTVKFTGREKWKRNIRLLVPFFEEPSIELKDIERVEDGETSLIITSWRLRTFLRFPWRPLIDIDGGTTHTLDVTKSKVVRHVEAWEVSGLVAIAQMFVPSDRAVWRKQDGAHS